MATPTKRVGKLLFFNNSENDLQVIVDDVEVRLSEESSSSSTKVNVGLKGKAEIEETGGGGGLNFGIARSSSDSAKYNWSKFIQQGEKLVTHGTAVEFLSGNDSLQTKYVTVRQDEHVYCVNQKTTGRYCFFISGQLLSYGEKICFDEKILLYNWKYQKYLGWYERKDLPCGKLGDDYIELKFNPSQYTDSKFVETNSFIRVTSLSNPVVDLNKDYLSEKTIMYSSNGGCIYFENPKETWDKLNWKIAKCADCLNSPGTTLCEGDTVTFTNKAWPNSYMKPMKNERWWEVECEPLLKGEEDILESRWIICKLRK